MFEWMPIESTAMTAIGYDPEAETIYVRFTDGKEWWYSACPQAVWDELNNILKPKPNGRYVV